MSRFFFSVVLCSFGLSLALLSVAARPAKHIARSTSSRAAAASWSIVDSPNTSTAESNRLWSVTCVSNSDCWAVGDHYPGNTVTSAKTLIQHWNGTSWSIVNSPDTGNYNTLYGLTCVTSSDCWAVGSYRSTQDSTLIQHWNGNAWSIVASPNPGTSQTNFLFGVTCASATECWAVGYSASATGYDTLIERWNGTSWAIVASPNNGPGQSNRLLGVTCASATNCFAIGYYYTVSDADARTLIERWDGNSWAIVDSPNALTAQNFLTAVDCNSATDCWAVGYTNNAGVTSNHKTLTEHWDGSAWAIINSPNSSDTQHNWLTGISCASASECWAVGYYIGATYQNLIEHWDGNSWTVVTAPNNGSSLNLLYGITCNSASDCWTVGVFSIVSAWQTLTEHYSVPLPALKIVLVNRASNGRFIVSGEAEPLLSINIEASPDLIAPFENIGSTTANATGAFEFEDLDAAGLSQRFYRAIYP